jgi:hypothetical protein
MTRFIKLNSIIINITSIKKILIKPNKYLIRLEKKKYIEICANKTPEDYKLFSKWIFSNE